MELEILAWRRGSSEETLSLSTITQKKVTVRWGLTKQYCSRNGLKLSQVGFRLDIKENFFPESVDETLCDMV